MSRLTRLTRLTRLALCAVCATPAAAAVLAPPALAGPSGPGVVVAHADADTFVVAHRGGELRALDAPTLPAIGSVVRVKARDGVARRVRIVGTTTRAQIRGTVSATAADRFTVTGRGDDDARVQISFAAPVTQPAIGRRVRVAVALDGTALRAVALRSQGRGASEVEGRIAAIDTTARRLTLRTEGGAELIVAVPVAFDLTRWSVGDEVELSVLLLVDGTYVLQRVDDRSGDDGVGSRSGDRSGDDRGDDDRSRGRGRDDRGDDDRGRGRGRDDRGDDDRSRGRGRDDRGDDDGGRGRGRDDRGDDDRGRGRGRDD